MSFHHNCLYFSSGLVQVHDANIKESEDNIMGFSIEKIEEGKKL